MEIIQKTINFFSPFSDEFEAAIEDFHLLSNTSYGTLKKAAVIGLSILGGLSTFYILFVGAFPAFRWAVTWLKGEEEQISIPRPGGEANPNANRVDEPVRRDPEVANVRGNLGVADGITEENVRAILTFDVAPKDIPWTGADLNNGSPLQQFWNEFRRIWVEDTNIRYDIPLPSIAEANLDDLMTLSTFEVRSMRHQIDPDQCIADLANDGTFLTWQNRLRQVWFAI